MWLLINWRHNPLLFLAAGGCICLFAAWSIVICNTDSFNSLRYLLGSILSAFCQIYLRNKNGTGEKCMCRGRCCFYNTASESRKSYLSQWKINPLTLLHLTVRYTTENCVCDYHFTDTHLQASVSCCRAKYFIFSYLLKKIQNHKQQ